MTDLNKLKEKVEALENIAKREGDHKKDQEQILQEIGAALVNEYVIKIGDLTIEPLLVEAYYYHEDKFHDDSVHAANKSNASTYRLARERQKNHFGELYVHYGTKDGIDVVLSMKNDYYLSFLIKNALINGKMETQSKISQCLCENCDKYRECQTGIKCQYYGDIILKSVEPRNYEIVFSPRRGLKNDFASCVLSALPINNIREYPYTAGLSRTEIIRSYIMQQLKKDQYNEEWLKQLAKGLIDWKKLKG